jgi:hypothetical protein
MIGSPSKKDYRGMVSSNLILNCPFLTTNVTNARAIFGPDLASVRGKTVWCTLAPVVADYVAVPCSLVKTNKVVALAADVFFVDGTAFLLTVLQRIKFVTVEPVPVQTTTSLSKHLKQVLKVYGRAGFRVKTILMDGEFEKIKPLMSTLECNMTVAKEHVSKAERTIRTLKEWTRGLLATLPFSNLPKPMKIEFVHFMALWLNARAKTGISSIYSPRKLLFRWQLDYKKHCWVLPRTYCKVHDEPVPTNMVVWQMHEGIALGPTGNLQGSIKFYCINIGWVLKCHSFTQIPMPDRVIKCLNATGAREGQGREFQFLNQPREPYGWTDEVPKDNPKFQGLLDKKEEAVYPNISAKLSGVELKEEEQGYQTVTDEPEDKFWDMAAMTSDNTGINPNARLCMARDAAIPEGEHCCAQPSLCR